MERLRELMGSDYQRQRQEQRAEHERIMAEKQQRACDDMPESELPHQVLDSMVLVSELSNTE